MGPPARSAWQILLAPALADGARLTHLVDMPLRILQLRKDFAGGRTEFLRWPQRVDFAGSRAHRIWIELRHNMAAGMVSIGRERVTAPVNACRSVRLAGHPRADALDVVARSHADIDRVQFPAPFLDRQLQKRGFEQGGSFA